MFLFAIAFLLTSSDLPCFLRYSHTRCCHDMKLILCNYLFKNVCYGVYALIVFKTKDNGLTEKRPVMATGSPGGSTIITVVLQNVLNHLEFGMNIAEATAAPRIHHQWLPDEVFVEPGISKDTLQMLQAMGHKIQNERIVLGRVQGISCSEASSTE